MNALSRNWFMRTGLLLVVFLGTACFDPNVESCEKIESIASSPEKIAYIEDWIKERIAEEEFLRHMGPLGRIDAIDDMGRFLKLGIDLELLGIDARDSFLRLHGTVSPGAAYMQESDITAVSIGQGRSGILILVDEDDVMGRLETAGHDGLRSFSEGVFVYCR